MRIHHGSDVPADALAGRKVAVLGYGSQGYAHANNLRDSGVAVAVGLRPDGASAGKAREAGFEVVPVPDAVAWADVVAVLLPDERQGDVYREQIAPRLRAGQALLFAHGFAVHFGQVVPPPDVDVCMAAPKGPGHLVRREFCAGGGVPMLTAVHQDATGRAGLTALGYATAVGGRGTVVIETTFREECETDLFGEQVVLCGGATALVQAAFETLVEAGYSPEMAYFECLHELKLTVDLMHQGGIAHMRSAISNTAKYGDVTRGPRVVTPAVKAEMSRILGEIQRGEFAREWMLENRVGRPVFNALLRQGAAHPIEEVGGRLRAMMPWLERDRPVERRAG